MATPVQVKRAQAHLLEHLYSAVTTLGGAEAEFLLEEESDSVVKREKLKQVLHPLQMIPTRPSILPHAISFAQSRKMLSWYDASRWG